MSFTKFDAPLMVVYDPLASTTYKKPLYRVTTPFSFYIGAKEDQKWVHVPEGYLTDGASVPKWLHWLIKPWGKHGQAAVVHDILCEIPYIQTAEGARIVSYNRIHKIFKEALQVTGNSKLKCFAMYWAVRAYFFFNGYKVDLSVAKTNQSLLRDRVVEIKQA